MTPTLSAARDAFLNKEVIFPRTRVTLPNTCVYENSERFNDPSFTDWLRRGHVSRTVAQDDITLGRYPPGALLHGRFSYALTADELLVTDQLAPWYKGVKDFDRILQDKGADAGRVSHPCLLAARFGETTWGHWLIELLPKIILAEMIHPNLFTFVVPAHIVRESVTRTYATSVLESLAAYGIERHRLLHVKSSENYVFDNLFDVIGIFDDGIHPSVIATVQKKLQAGTSTPGSRHVALLRPAGDRRSIYNHSDVTDILKQQHFRLANPADMSFIEQVDVFRNADVICADLGSNLAGLIYAKQGIRVLTTAPSGWRDGYFVNILQRLCAFTADLRGASTFLSDSPQEQRLANSPYIVPTVDFQDALHAMIEVTSKPPRFRSVVTANWAPRFFSSTLTIPVTSSNDRSLLFLDGWSPAEEHHRWTISPKASLELSKNNLATSLATAPEQLFLEIRGTVFTNPLHRRDRRLDIWLNDQPLATAISDGPIHIQSKISRSQITAAAHLGFVIEEMLSPRELQLSADNRRLGFALQSISIGWDRADEAPA